MLPGSGRGLPARSPCLLGSRCDPSLGRAPHGSGITLPAAGMQAFRFRDREKWTPARSPCLLGSRCDPRLGRAPHGSGITLPAAGMQAFRFRDREKWTPARSPCLLGSRCDPSLGGRPMVPESLSRPLECKHSASGIGILEPHGLSESKLFQESYVVFVEEAHVVDLVF